MPHPPPVSPLTPLPRRSAAVRTGVPVTALHVDQLLAGPPLALFDGGQARVALAEPEASQTGAVAGDGETADVARPAGGGRHREHRLQLQHGGVEPLERL